MSRLLSHVTIGAALLLFAAGGGWCAGARHTRLSAYDAARKHLVDTITLVKTQLKVDSVKVVETKIVMDSARSRFAYSDIRIKVLGDSAISIDGVPPASMIPAISVIPEIQNARAMHLADSIGYRAVVAKLQHTELLVNLETQRADLAEHRIKELKGPHVGVKTGVLFGGTIVYVATHPQQILRATKWMLQLVH